MAVRASMAELITSLRMLVNDPSGSSAQFTDQQLQDVLDQHQTPAMYEQLQAIYNVTSGGVSEYKKFVSTHGYFESDASLSNGSYGALTATTSNYIAGVWTFAASQSTPVCVYGNYYDIHASAADVWDLKAATYADRFDFSADGGNYSQSQQVKHAQDRANYHRSKSTEYSGLVHLCRTDVSDD